MPPKLLQGDFANGDEEKCEKWRKTYHVFCSVASHDFGFFGLIVWFFISVVMLSLAGTHLNLNIYN